MLHTLRALLVSFLCIFLCGCDLLIYPVTGFNVLYTLEVPKDAKTGDFLQYSFTVQNPYRGWINSWIFEKSEPFEKKADNRFVMQLIDDSGKIAWEESSSIFWMPDLPYSRIGKTTFRVSVNDNETLEDLKAGKRKLYMSIIRLADMKLGPWLSTRIGEEKTLTPVIVPAESAVPSEQKIIPR